ncbi:antibiotic biosynthesis monooxygenase [Fangia hongkongensis]|uniref:antibiotic biosynthesis monooxygenase n=1 Tax=Fangia hongkongensis TaxID=270495 RepID=UPI00035FEE22|nr:antibiotic biosynthesis monooxygenase [Fangia hongkongensis]MBK2125455.1 antibiotic biosynthesis monooxygenase [Fangia hongkongensis]
MLSIESIKLGAKCCFVEIMSILIVDSLSVPIVREKDYVDLWRYRNDIIQKQPGWLSSRLGRRVIDDKTIELVIVIEWYSKQHFNQAFRTAINDEGFLEKLETCFGVNKDLALNMIKMKQKSTVIYERID